MPFPLTKRTSRAGTGVGDRYTVIVRELPDRSFGWEVWVNGLQADARSEDWVRGGIEANHYAAAMAAHAALGVVLRKELL